MYPQIIFMLTFPLEVLVQVFHYTVMNQHKVGQIQINKIIQPNIVDRIKRPVCSSYVRLASVRNNPTEKDLLVVTGCQGNLLIDKIPEENSPVVRGAGTF